MTANHEISPEHFRDRWIHPGCNQDVALGFVRLANDVTESHSLTSHRYSFWSLVAKHVDRPFERCVASYPDVWVQKLFLGFQPSGVGRCAPLPIELMKLDPHKTDFMKEFPPPSVDKKPKIADMLQCVAIWRSYVRAVIRTILEVPADSEPAFPWHPLKEALVEQTQPVMELRSRRSVITQVSVNEGKGTSRQIEVDGSPFREDPDPKECFLATLESMLKFLGSLDVFSPKRVKNEDQGQDNGLKQFNRTVVRANKVGPQPFTYCELCWRPSARIQMQDERSEYFPTREHSKRFCRIHDPSDPSSLYRSDVYYRELFHHELKAANGLTRSAYAFRLNPPEDATRDECRKAVYDLIHALPRPDHKSSNDKLRRLEDVWRLYQKGMRQIEISRRLGLSKQSVSYSLNRLNEIAVLYRNEAAIDPKTCEPFCLAGDGDEKSDKLFSDVARLRSQEWSPAEIAQHVRRSRNTVRAVYLWLDDSSLRKKCQSSLFSDLMYQRRGADRNSDDRVVIVPSQPHSSLRRVR